MTLSEQQRCDALLAWYDQKGRLLPWRMEKPDPYKTWLSEIMLQQTTVITVKPYFKAFTERWPTVEKLAAAELDQVLHAWQGLGYYARARNLHACAKVIADDYDGVFPDQEKELLSLPGIGPYTAGAIAAIAYNRISAPVDGNIERVFSRLFRLRKPSPGLRTDVASLLMPMVPANRSGDFIQALMDLGATVCRPKKPVCEDCPWTGVDGSGCAAFWAGETDLYPVRKPKKKIPTRRGIVFWIETADGQIYLRRRAEKGLLGGLMEFPSTAWHEQPWKTEKALAEAPFDADWNELPDKIKHTFTHFHLELTVFTGQVPKAQEAEGVWSTRENLSSLALPTLMKKVEKYTKIVL